MRKVIQHYGWLPFMALLFRYWMGGKKIKVPGIPGKILIRPRSSDREVFKKIFLKHEYNFNQIRDVKYIVDAGAYTGLSAIYFKSAFPESKIICVEASPVNYDTLKENVGADPGIITLNKALWNEITTLKFTESESKPFGSKVVNDGSDNSIIVDSITINNLLNEYKFPFIDLLKIDIEGSEKELFESNYHSWLTKTKYIVIELHDRFKPGCAKALFKALDSINYSLHLKGENILIINNDFMSPTR